jgi:hypothetical protein
MKIRYTILILLSVFLFFSCGFGGTSMRDRMEAFFSDVNNAPGSAYRNFSDDAEDKASIDATYFSTGAWSDRPYSYSSVSESGNTLTVTRIGNSSGTSTVRFDMQDEGDFFSGANYLIRRLYINGTLTID